MYSCSPCWWCLGANHRSSMISSQGAPSFSHCRVQSIKKVSLPAAAHIASSGLHAIPFTNTAARHSKPICQRPVLLATFAAFHRYIKLSCLCLPQASPRKSSRVHAPAVLPVCAKLLLPSQHLYYGNSHLSKQQPWNTMRRQLSTSASNLASAGNADAVYAEFAKAGISAEATNKVLS